MEMPTDEKLRRLDHPLASTDRRPLFWDFCEDQKVPYETLRKELAQESRQVLARVRKSD